MARWQILANLPDAMEKEVSSVLTESRLDHAEDMEKAVLAARRVPYDVVLVYADQAEELAFDTLKRLRKIDPHQAIIFLSDKPELTDAVRAIRLGAYDFLRSQDIVDELPSAVERAAERGRLSREVMRLREEVDKVRGVQDMVGSSQPMKQLMALTERVATADATVLILGESGTGKELLARNIHRLGPRSDRPFVAFDCSALSPGLLEAELFGHEKGAFTGAGRARRGLFREADTGTIFLDEIGDIAPEVQNKLLRVLQEREIKPVGGDRFVPVNVRVLAATNKDLRSMVNKGKFREDLYWRLAVVPIQVPPLRERRDDISAISAHILAKRRGAAKSFAGSEVPYPSQISPVAMSRLQNYHWPGNIRELENVLSRAAILCDGDEIRGDDLVLAGLSESDGEVLVDAQEGRPLASIVDEAVRRVERAAISGALARSDGSVSQAAEILGISRASVYNKMKKYGIREPAGV